MKIITDLALTMIIYNNFYLHFKQDSLFFNITTLVETFFSAINDCEII